MINPTLLLVEDESIIGLATKMKLEEYGHTVILVNSGNAALDLIQGSEDETINMILMDIDLGRGMNGVDTAKEILKIIDIPIIFVSSHIESEIINLAQTVTGYGYIVKSSNVIVYNTAISMALNLFKEKNRSEIYANYVTTALQKSSEPFFICNGEGDIEFFNNEYLKIQGLTNPKEIERRYKRYKEQILVFSDNGELLADDDIASIRPLRGLEGDNVVFYVYNKKIDLIIGNEYTYAPVYHKKKIVGSYVKIGKSVEVTDESLKEKLNRAIRSAPGAKPGGETI